ncbi:hypothetical protein ACFLXZ_00295 [Chloroflexota bacterium]
MFWRFYERTVEILFINPVSRWISFDPSQSRWGTFSFLISVSFFFFSLSSAIYAVYITLLGGVVMLPVSPNVLFVMFWVVFGVGTLFGIIAFVLAIYFLRTQNTTATTKDAILLRKTLNRINKELSKKRVKKNGN